jgi:hypothetical protein
MKYAEKVAITNTVRIARNWISVFIGDLVKLQRQENSMLINDLQFVERSIETWEQEIRVEMGCQDG